MISKRIIHIFIVVLMAIPLHTSYGSGKVFLTHRNINNFIESMEEVKQWNEVESKSLQKETGLYEDTMDFLFPTEQTPFEAILYSSKDPYLRSQLDKIVQAFDFDNTKHWIDVGDRISNAYLSLHGAFNKEEGRKQLNSANDRINDSHGMPTGYQNVMQGIIGEAQMAVSEIDDIGADEIELVKRNIPLLGNMFTK